MKRKILSAVALLIAILCIPAAVAFAHSGGTDENGGHWDHSTGTYHYHHGYPAHQHPNGICPYLDDAPEESSESSRRSTAQERIATTLEKLEASGYLSDSTAEYSEAYESGYADGYSAAYAINADASEIHETYQEGYDMGYLEGSEEAMEYYYDEGYYDGELEGYDSGYDEGYDEGYDMGTVMGAEEKQEEIDEYHDSLTYRIPTFIFSTFPVLAIVFWGLWADLRKKYRDLKSDFQEQEFQLQYEQEENARLRSKIKVIPQDYED